MRAKRLPKLRPRLLVGRLSFSFIFLLTHQGKFGTTQGKVGAQLGVHFSGRGSFRGAKRQNCRCSRLAGADPAPWELSLSLPVALARHCDNPRSAVSRLIFGAKRRHLQPAENLCDG